jgi:predicted dehydrogenase
MLSVALVGSGRMGRVRAEVLAQSAEARLAAVADPDLARAREIAGTRGALAFSDWREAIARPEIDVVILATPTKFHAEIAIAALEAGKHVLCEKPLARNVEEAARMLATAQRAQKLLKTGFNYRYMPHVRKAKELIDAGDLGSLYLVRSRFGHGGRPGYEKEWHTNRELSGGGVLLEQGIHLLDLVRYLLGEPSKVLGSSHTFFWDIPGVEDNCFCLLETALGQTAQIHVSWTQWKNILEMEIFGHQGYIRLEGRDGHYGPPRLVWGKRNSDHSRPQELLFEYQPGDCWRDEWDDFVAAMHDQRQPSGSAHDGLRAQQLVEAAYLSSSQRRWVELANS